MNTLREDSTKASANHVTLMSRREALTRIAVLMGGTFIATDAFLHGAPLAGKTSRPAFTADDFALMDEIGETIIPATDTPGAKAAGVSGFMAIAVTDCYTELHQQLFQEGLKNIEQLSQQRFQKSFRTATPAQRTELLNGLDREQREVQHRKANGDPPHPFRLVKELVLVGYFTSEIGANQALRYIEVPGRYDGNTLYKAGDPVWFVPPSRNLLSGHHATESELQKSELRTPNKDDPPTL
jgi:hypothetical protein